MFESVSAGYATAPLIDRAAKRIVDIVIAVSLLILLSPVFLIVGFLILCSSPGPLFYRQKRVGRDGRIFDIYKFRTMYCDADKRGPSVTSADDCRITRIGRRLRSYKLDELPQFLNVLRGDMSLVGPRPQVPQYVKHFDPRMRDVVLGVRPGITGPTALVFRREEDILANREDREAFYIDRVIPVKLGMDVQYVQTRSFWEDIKILSETALLLTPARSISSYAKADPRTLIDETIEALR